jgi:hypothetical protein
MVKKYCDICGNEISDNITDYRFTIDLPTRKQIQLCETCTTARLLNIIRENPGMTFSGCLEDLYDTYYVPEFSRH